MDKMCEKGADSIVEKMFGGPVYGGEVTGKPDPIEKMDDGMKEFLNVMTHIFKLQKDIVKKLETVEKDIKYLKGAFDEAFPYVPDEADGLDMPPLTRQQAKNAADEIDFATIRKALLDVPTSDSMVKKA